MKVTYHARQRRGVPYNIVKKEVVDGVLLEKELARTLLDRADNRRFKDEQDRFILRKDLLGMYILSKRADDSDWVVVTHIDLSDNFRQSLLKKLFNKEKDLKAKATSANEAQLKNINSNMSISKAIMKKFSFEEISEIKRQISEETFRFNFVQSFPCTFYCDLIFNDTSYTFRINKKSPYKETRISLAS